MSTPTPSTSSSSLRAWGFMAIGALMFAVMNLAAREASREVHFTIAAAARSWLGAAVAYGAARARGVSLEVRDKRRMWLRSIFGTFAMLATFFTLSRRELALGDAATLFNLAPIGVALLSVVMLGETLGARLWVSLTLSLAGVVLILHPEFLFGAHEAHASRTIAVTGAIVAAAFAALAMVMLRQVGQTESAEAIAVRFSLFASVTFSLASVPFWRPMSMHTATALLVAGIAAGIGQLAMTRAYALERAARVSSMGYANVPMSALLGMLVLGERPTTLAYVGMVLVILGGAILGFAPRPASPATATH